MFVISRFHSNSILPTTQRLSFYRFISAMDVYSVPIHSEFPASLLPSPSFSKTHQIAAAWVPGFRFVIDCTGTVDLRPSHNSGRIMKSPLTIWNICFIASTFGWETFLAWPCYYLHFT